jgi:hypothetical protein
LKADRDVILDGLDHFDGGTRMVVGINGTAGIWATYPQEFVSIPTALGDQASTGDNNNKKNPKKQQNTPPQK